MQKRTRVLTGVAIGLVVLIVAVLVGSRLYGNWVNSNADEAPTLGGTSASTPESTSEGTPEATSGAPVTGDLDGDWTVSEGSFAGYRVQEVLNGQDVTVTGRTEGVTGAVSIVGGDLTAGTIEVDLTTVSTPESQRDEYFRSNALETDEFPTATFTLTEPVAVVPDGGDLALVGDLTIHGVTQQVTVTAQAGASDGGLQVVGSMPITFADFDVEAPDLGFVVVEDAGSIEFSLELAAG